MNFKVLSVAAVLIGSVCFSGASVAEEMPENPKYKEARIEKDLNDIFERGLRLAAYKLDNKEDIRPFAVIKKNNGKVGVFELDANQVSEKMSINKMSFSVRRYLTELAIAKQIQASVLVMYATVEPKGEKARQGLSFEIEHLDGVSMMRFVPISPAEDENSKLIIHTELISAAIKPATVFTEMVKAIAATQAKKS